MPSPAPQFIGLLIHQFYLMANQSSSQATNKYIKSNEEKTGLEARIKRSEDVKSPKTKGEFFFSEERNRNLRGEITGITNKGIPPHRGVQINEIPQQGLWNGNPSKDYNDSFEISGLFSSPVDITASNGTTTTTFSSFSSTHSSEMTQ